jgi:hypothetical protein
VPLSIYTIDLCYNSDDTEFIDDTLDDAIPDDAIPDDAILDDALDDTLDNALDDAVSSNIFPSLYLPPLLSPLISPLPSHSLPLDTELVRHKRSDIPLSLFYITFSL